MNKLGERARSRRFICGIQRAQRKTKAGFVARLFHVPYSSISPAIIVHTPDARITAASTASRKSNCLFSSHSFSNWLLCVAP